VLPLTHADKAGVFFGGADVESEMLARLLEHSSAVYLMAASIPARDVDRISEAMRRGEGLKAVVFDAYASEFVDGTLDVIMARKNRRCGAPAKGCPNAVSAPDTAIWI
jgi:hypothetical protein